MSRCASRIERSVLDDHVEESATQATKPANDPSIASSSRPKEKRSRRKSASPATQKSAKALLVVDDRADALPIAGVRVRARVREVHVERLVALAHPIADDRDGDRPG